ncbi:MAG: Gfo/Idh/MocA family oxidoreductase [Chloroflexia bacterium]|nr:Gfo/Idh/MocA family oxidoreductase [Chloroflexia bacterium]
MYRGVLVGAGGFGGVWARQFLPHFRDRVDIVGVADIEAGARDRAALALGVPEEQRYDSYERMLAEVEADICFLVIPPAARTGAVRAAAGRGMAILCEKPIAASWEQTLEIGEIARAAGIKFAIMQNYREQSRIRALKRVLQRPELRKINLIESRFAVNYTIDTAGGAFRHQIPDAFIYEGAEHHLDQIRNLTGVDADWVQGHQWGQSWSTFGGSTTLALLIRMSNGVMVTYEMNHVERGPQNGWHSEYYRINTEGGTVVLDADDVIRIVQDTTGGEVVDEVTPVPDAHDEHYALIGQFLDWMDGGAAPFNVFEDNVRTMALTFAAVEATHTGERVDVGALLASSRL